MSPNHRSKADRAVVATTGDDMLLDGRDEDAAAAAKEGDGVRRRGAA